MDEEHTSPATPESPKVHVTWDKKSSLGPGKVLRFTNGLFFAAIIALVIGFTWWFTGRDKVVATVGDVALTESVCLQMTEHYYAQQTKGQTLSPEEEEKVREICWKRVISEFIQREVLTQSIQQHNITLDDAFRTAYIKRIELATKRSIDDILAQSSVGELEARARLEQEMLAEKLIHDLVTAQIQITDDEVKAERAVVERDRKTAFEQMQSYMEQLAMGESFEELVQKHSRIKSPGIVTVDILRRNPEAPLAQPLLTLPEGGISDICEDPVLLHIVKVIKRTPEKLYDTTAERQRAEEVRTLLLDGEDFATVAKEYSDCPSKENGGSLGTFGKGEMVPEFETAAFTQPIGTIGALVESHFGYHIIKVTARDEAKGTVEASHILIKAKIKDPETIEYLPLSLAMPAKLTDEQTRAVLLYQRTVSGAKQFLEEQKRVLGATCPDYPELASPQP